MQGESVRDILIEGYAETILKWLGVNKFLAMTGAKNLVKDKKTLMFMLGRNKASANKVIITLNSSDLYDVEFGRIRSGKYKTLKKFNDVFGAQLQEVFTSYTGLDTHL